MRTTSVSSEFKTQGKAAEAILGELGISISTAYELFYRQIIANGGLPAPDWFLIHSITDFELRPSHLGIHSELFE